MPLSTSHMKDILASIRNPAWVSFAWFGMTAGISLLEAPVKFTAPTITREVALDVGRVVFAALHKAEFIALILLLILVRIGGRSRELFGLCAGLATIMIIQSVWLLPELSSRAQSIIEGVEPGPSIAHAAYAILELLKLLLLLYFGFRSMHTAIRAS